MRIERTRSAVFTERVRAIVAAVPVGRVVTYGQVASLAGRPGAAREVGWIAHAGGVGLPWYRVVNATGGLARGYEGGRQGHRAALETATRRPEAAKLRHLPTQAPVSTGFQTRTGVCFQNLLPAATTGFPTMMALRPGQARSSLFQALLPRPLRFHQLLGGLPELRDLRRQVVYQPREAQQLLAEQKARDSTLRSGRSSRSLTSL